MTGAKLGSFDDLLALTPEELQPIVRALDAVIRDVDPDTVEVVRLGDRAASYGCGPKKMSESYAYILPYQGWVNLGFYHAASLADPDGLLEGTGARMRHVKVRNVDLATSKEIRDLIAAAVEERRHALGMD